MNGSPGPKLRRIDGPFPLAVTDAAFRPDVLARLEALFDPPQDWVRHQDHFYRCFIAEVHDALPQPWLKALREHVGQALGLPLAGPVRVTAQRMEPDDGSDRHTDRPLVGYECARLVVQLDDAVGGHFRAFDGDTVWLDRPPRPNQAVAFELCRSSVHDVTPCTGTRRTVVFHFWHVANPIDAREALDRELAGVSLRDLPLALGPHMDAAEAACSDVDTYRAALTASLLRQWGEPVERVIPAYLACVYGRDLSPRAAWAAWLVHLHTEDFHRPLWEALPRPAPLGPSRQRWLGLGAEPR